MPYSRLHAAARNYAEAGWPVFPCRENGKEPACANGYKDATTVLEKIDFWWADNPNYNIGFCPENAGLCVVDEDTDKGGRYDATAVETVKSPHGRHIYYAGSLPASASRIGPHIDTRGRGSYVLLPPSVVDGLEYLIRDPDNFPCQSYECSEVPDWIVALFNTTAEPRKSVINATDRPQAIAAFKRYLEKNPLPSVGAGSDDACYRAIARGRDLGLSDEMVFRAIGDMSEEYEDWWILEKIENVEMYAQNEAGCDIPLTATESNAKLLATVLPANSLPDDPAKTTIPRLKGRPPRDPATIPELGYHDDDKFIPKSPDGCIGILYGKRGDHKTNTLLSMLSNSGAQRILYAAGEGSFGVERDRIPAHPSFKNRIYIVPGVPNLGDPAEVKEFIELNNEYAPEIVVIDTWQTAIGSEDDNSSVTAFQLSDNGACGTIKHAWNCTLIVVDHAGKDEARGVRGSSAKEGNVDFVLHVSADKKKNVIKSTVTKMRDGYDGLATHWKYDPDPNKVPVPERISESEYTKLVTEDRQGKGIDNSLIVMSYLRLNGFHDWASGATTPELAALLTEQERGVAYDENAKNEGEWRTTRDKWRKALDAAKNKVWGKQCTDERYFNGGSEMILRWFCPPQDQDSTEL